LEELMAVILESGRLKVEAKCRNNQVIVTWIIESGRKRKAVRAAGR
jgi:hypothetical protein